MGGRGLKNFRTGGITFARGVSTPLHVMVEIWYADPKDLPSESSWIKEYFMTSRKKAIFFEYFETNSRSRIYRPVLPLPNCMKSLEMSFCNAIFSVFIENSLIPQNKSGA